jgi:heme/copper-type cytochrome/quinol oxidase subunit 2
VVRARSRARRRLFDTRVTLTPDKEGTYPFHCDVFCGDGHEDMTGTLVVTPD